MDGRIYGLVGHQAAQVREELESTYERQLEADRLRALRRYEVLDTPPEESFDRITRLVQAALQTPIALVSLLDESRQWFKSCQGLDVRETPRDISFCTHAIKNDEPLIVEDALNDARFAENPLVINDPNIRFYAGVPLHTPDGYRLGTLCAIDRQPREISPAQLAVLQDLARIVVDELELRTIARIDPLTGLMTRRSFDLDTAKEVARYKRYGSALTCIKLDLDHFKAINDTFGHAGGDAVLREIGLILKSGFRDADVVGRLGGEEFCIALTETKPDRAHVIAERIRAKIEGREIPYQGKIIKVTASLGVAGITQQDRAFADIISRADSALYKAKADGRNRVVAFPF